MINVIALTVSGKELNFADRFSIAGIVTLQGMLTIFLVLAILWGTIEIMHACIHRKPKKRRKTKQVPQMDSDSSADQAILYEIPSTPLADGDEVIAAITAAISAMLSEKGHTGAFRVVSFKRRGTAKKTERYN